MVRRWLLPKWLRRRILYSLFFSFVVRPCRRGAPQLVEKYNTIVASNPKFEMIHVSLDRDSRAAGGWAVNDGLPWLHIMPENAEKSGFLKYKSTGFVPEYALVKADGTRLATDGEVFPMAKQLASQ